VQEDRTVAIGSEIRDARRRKGWTQADLAARLAVSMRTVSRWEGGASAPRFKERERLAELLGIPMLSAVSRHRRPATRPADFLEGVRTRIASALAAYSAQRGV
jgi:transcriptional regulator with XRE-family HTH domain